MTPYRLVPLLFTALLLAPAVHAQTVPFGKNKVQYRSFQWRILEGEHVDVYYYPEEEALARLTLAYAEESVRDLSRAFQHHPFHRIPLIVYASRQHFEQTNVYPGLIPEGVLGFTEYLKGRIALPFRGDYAQFRRTLRHELVHAFQLSKLDEVRTLYPRQRRFSPQQIQWWTEGLAEYWSTEPSTQAKMFVRDMVLNGKVPSIRAFSRATGYAAYPLGAELHRFLTDRFGERYILEVYETYWRHESFEKTLESVLGVDLDELSKDWRRSLQNRYFPVYSQRSPPEVAAVPILFEGGGSVKPTLLGDSTPHLYFLSARGGYTSLFRTPLSDGEQGVERVLQGETSAQFESLNATESRIDAHDDGLVALVSRYLDRDALIIIDTESSQTIGRYQWPDLVGIKSPSWGPDGRRIVFEGLSTSGMSDLYTVDLESHQRTRLTADRYRDWSADWSPDGRYIVFASDRTPFGDEGHNNLFLLDLTNGKIRYLTFGPWNDHSPRWSRDGSRIAFTSDRQGVADLYTIDTNGTGRRLTRLTSGAFDPEWLPDDEGLIFSAFSEGTFRIYRLTFTEDTTAGTEVSLARVIADALVDDAQPSPQDNTSNSGWKWSELSSPRLDQVEARAYSSWNRFSLDIAGGDAFIAPGIGTAQGAQFLASDMLGNHMLFANLSSFHGVGGSSLFDHLSGTVLYLNLSRRLNFGVGAFRISGRTRNVDLDVFEEVGHGGYVLASYPFSRFRRVEVQLGVERNERRSIAEPGEVWAPDTPEPDSGQDRSRTGLLMSNFVAYIKDNTRWVATGPIDGERFHLMAGFVTCFVCRLPSDVTGKLVRQGVSAEKFTVSADYRRYLRTSASTAYALRAFGYFSDGTLPGRAVLGGPQRLRGYPRRSLAGSRVGWINQEWRFPVSESMSLTLPFGTIRTPGIQGAAFLDSGASWTANRPPKGFWGSYGVGLRSAIVAPLVVRIDAGRTFAIGESTPVTGKDRSPIKRLFVDLYFGYNY